jgi:hypothetical protein
LADLGGELDVGRAGTDDHDIDARGVSAAAWLSARTQQAACVMAEALGVACSVERYGGAVATPGTPKSLVVLPTQKTSMS